MGVTSCKPSIVLIVTAIPTYHISSMIYRRILTVGLILIVQYTNAEQQPSNTNIIELEQPQSSQPATSDLDDGGMSSSSSSSNHLVDLRFDDTHSSSSIAVDDEVVLVGE